MNKVLEQFATVLNTIKEVALQTFEAGCLQVMPATLAVRFGRTLSEIESMPLSTKMALACALTELVGEFYLSVHCNPDEEDSNKLFFVKCLTPDPDLLPEGKLTPLNEGYIAIGYGRLAEIAVQGFIEEIVSHYIHKVALTNKIPQ